VVVHDRAEAWALADRLLVLIGGELVAEGPPRAVLAQPPTRQVARFLGYDGELRDRDRLLLTRPAQVRIDPDGPLQARVTGMTPQEDTVRLELTLGNGVVYATCPWSVAPALGTEVRVRIDDPVAFPNDPAG
jgi:ABC-type sulfate/molybdate transport systems ATPase subunit